MVGSVAAGDLGVSRGCCAKWRKGLAQHSVATSPWDIRPYASWNECCAKFCACGTTPPKKKGAGSPARRAHPFLTRFLSVRHQPGDVLPGAQLHRRLPLGQLSWHPVGPDAEHGDLLRA